MGRRLSVSLLVAGVLTVAGCASTYYDPLPPNRTRAEDIMAVHDRSLEQVYRQLYTQLEQCYATSYHVQPRFERTRGEAWIMLVSGLGLNRYSLVGNRFEARVDMRRSASGVQVSVTQREGEVPDLAAQIERWLGGARACRG